MKLSCIALVFAFVIASAYAVAISEESYKYMFESWKQQHMKSYASDAEHRYRFSIWRDNLDFVVEHNADSTNTYKVAMNKFGDLTEVEFSMRLGKRARNAHDLPSKAGNGTLDIVNIRPEAVPESFDWRTKNVITAIKDQGDCGSCWSYSSVGAMESALAIKGAKLVTLSEQQLVDCSTENYGCDGGLIDLAFDYIVATKGVDLASCYAYTGKDGSCKYKSSCSGGKISTYKALKSGDEAALKTATATYGPVAIGIYASSRSFMLYSSGILNDKTCKNKLRDLDHAVVVVGYGVQGSQKFWIIKNSWGTGWGEAGYLLIARDANNMCGVGTESFYPIV